MSSGAWRAALRRGEERSSKAKLCGPGVLGEPLGELLPGRGLLPDSDVNTEFDSKAASRNVHGGVRRAGGEDACEQAE